MTLHLHKNKQGRMKDKLITLYKLKDIVGLELAALEYPKYANKARCYIDRLNRKASK